MNDIFVNLLQNKKANAIVTCYFEFAQLKCTLRRGWLQHGIPADKCESVAEHTFSMALLAMLVADKLFPQLAVEKILRMCLIHDIAEAYTGDYTPKDKITTADKHRQEQQAMQIIFSKLSGNYLELWQEYKEQHSAEAKFVKQMDRLDMAMQASIYEKVYENNLDEFFIAVKQQLDESLQEIFDVLENERTPFEAN